MQDPKHCFICQRVEKLAKHYTSAILSQECWLKYLVYDSDVLLDHIQDLYKSLPKSCVKQLPYQLE